MVDLLGNRELRDGLSRGESCCVDDARRFSLLSRIPSAPVEICRVSELLDSSAAPDGWVVLSDAGRLVAVGEGNGEASFPLFETEMGSGFLDLSVSGSRSASCRGAEANRMSVMVLLRDDH